MSAEPPGGQTDQTLGSDTNLEAVLTENSRVVLNAFSHFGFGYLLVKRGGAIVDANEQMLRLVGYTIDELRALPDVSSLLAPAERAIRAEYRRLRRESSETLFGLTRTEVLHRAGHTIRVELVPTPLGAGEYTVIVLKDLTEVSGSERLIDQYHALCERMPVGVMIVTAVDTSDGPRLRLWSANNAASIALKMDLRSRIGETLFDIFPGHAHEDERRKVFSVLRTGHTEQLPDIIIGDPSAPDAAYRRVVIALPGDALAMLIEDITTSVRKDCERRALMERIVELGDSDRRTIALGIHDDPLQQIAAAALLIGQLRRRNEPPPQDWLADADTALHRAMDSLRHLVFVLGPPELVESGLGTALAAASDYLFSGTGVWVHVDCPETASLAVVIGDTAFRIATEALTNIRKHAEAKTVRVLVDVDGSALRLSVHDDGRGFDGSSGTGHFGLRNMRDRAEAVGGTCGVTSGSSGTTVTAVLPLTSAPTPQPQELVTSLKELDRERIAIRTERDSLRRRFTELVEASEITSRKLSSVTGLQATLKGSTKSAAQRALEACKFLAGGIVDGIAIRTASRSDTTLRRLASWHPVPAQLDYLNQYLFVDRTTETSQAHHVFRSGNPVLIDPMRGSWSHGNGPLPPPGPNTIHSAILVAIHGGGRTLGVMTVCRDQTPGRLDESDLELCATLADIIGSHLTEL